MNYINILDLGKVYVKSQQVTDEKGKTYEQKFSKEQLAQITSCRIVVPMFDDAYDDFQLEVTFFGTNTRFIRFDTEFKSEFPFKDGLEIDPKSVVLRFYKRPDKENPGQMLTSDRVWKLKPLQK